MSPVLKSMAKSFVVAAICTAGVVLVAGLVVGEERRAEQLSSNEWLAKDLASQFSAAGSRTLARAQKYGLLSNVEAGSFDALAGREFEVDTGVKAVWMLDIPGEGSFAPLSRLERSGFALSESQAESLKFALTEASHGGAAVQNLGMGLTAVVVRLGERPRFVALLGDDSLFKRAAGGPLGERWMFVQRKQDGAGRVLYESPENVDASFPTLSEIERVLLEESPGQERAEFSTTIDSKSGPFYISGMQTGFFEVIAVSMTPIDRSMGFIRTIGELAIGLVIGTTLLTGIASWLWHLKTR